MRLAALLWKGDKYYVYYIGRTIQGDCSFDCKVLLPLYWKNWHCAEVECTVQMIYEFLWPHVEWDDAKQDVEKLTWI